MLTRVLVLTQHRHLAAHTYLQDAIKKCFCQGLGAAGKRHELGLPSSGKVLTGKTGTRTILGAREAGLQLCLQDALFLHHSAKDPASTGPQSIGPPWVASQYSHGAYIYGE
jgi:hypothetical protein